VTSALDVSIQAEIMQLLYRLKQSMGISLLFISHDIALVSGISDRVAVMHDGKIVETGDTMALIENPKQDYTKELIASVLPVYGEKEKIMER